jgi:hypothetical protein
LLPRFVVHDRLRHLVAVALVALLLGNVVSEIARGVWNVSAGGASDWLPFMAAARLLAHGSHCLYCAAPIAAQETAIMGHPVTWLLGTLTFAGGRYAPFLNPPLAALLVLPLALLPAPLGFALFALASVAAIAISHRVLTSGLGCPPYPTALALLAVPGVLGLALGQWAALLTLALVLALRVLPRRPVLAGLLLSLLLIKPQYLWLVPVMLAVTGRWRALAGLAVGGALMAASSLALVGPAQSAAWLSDALTAGSDQLTMTFGLPGLLAAPFGAPAAYLAFALGGTAVIAGGLRWRARLAARPELALAAFACLSLVVAPHVLVQDYLVLAPALALSARLRPRLAAAAALGLSAIFLGDLHVGSLGAVVGFLTLAGASAVPVATLVHGPWVPPTGGGGGRWRDTALSRGARVALRG